MKRIPVSSVKSTTSVFRSKHRGRFIKHPSPPHTFPLPNRFPSSDGPRPSHSTTAPHLQPSPPAAASSASHTHITSPSHPPPSQSERTPNQRGSASVDDGHVLHQHPPRSLQLDPTAKLLIIGLEVQ